MSRATIPKDAKEAVRFYEMWAQKPSKRRFHETFFWPDDPVLFGLSTRITYISDKFYKNGELVRYVHKFKSPQTQIVVQRPERAKSKDEKRVAKKRPLKDAPLPPGKASYTVLGHCLHLEYRETQSGRIKFWKFPEGDEPILVAQKDRENVLILVWPNDTCWIVTSPLIRITKRGILN